MNNKIIYVITTVGTSIFDNYRQTFLNSEKNINDAIENLKDLEANKLDLNNPSVIKLIGDEEEWGIDEKFFKGHIIKENGEWIQIYDENRLNTHASAEITSILKIHEKYGEDVKLKVHLLASDTVLSVLAGVLVKSWFEVAQQVDEKFNNIEIIFNENVNSPNADYIENLRTDLPKEQIYIGFDNLIKKVLNIKDGVKKKVHDVILNITAGYKGFIPIMTIVAQLENIKLTYIYENSEELIEIGQFPIDFDYFIASTYHFYLENLGRVNLSNEELKKLQQLQLIDTNKKLTGLGKLFKHYLESKVDFRKDVLGHYYEHKLFYHIFKYKNFNKDKLIESLKGFYLNELGKKINNGEIDLILKKDDEYIFIEVFSYGKKASKIEEQINKYIEYADNNKLKLKKIILFIYKMDFQNLIHKNSTLLTIRNLCTSKNTELKVFYVDIPISNSGLVNYKTIFENDLDIKEYKINE